MHLSTKLRLTLRQCSLSLGNIVWIFSIHGNNTWRISKLKLPNYLQLRFMVGNSMGIIYLISPYMYRTADAVVFPFQEELFSSDSSSVDWWAPKGQSRSYTTYEQMKWVNCFKVEYLALVKFGEGAHGEELYLQAVGSLKALPGKYKFLCRKSKSSFLSQTASTHIQCRTVMCSGARDQSNHSGSELCEKLCHKPGKKAQLNTFAIQQGIFSSSPQIFW